LVPWLIAVAFFMESCICRRHRGTGKQCWKYSPVPSSSRPVYWDGVVELPEVVVLPKGS
jgi:hypothetical protein